MNIRVVIFFSDLYRGLMLPGAAGLSPVKTVLRTAVLLFVCVFSIVDADAIGVDDVERAYADLDRALQHRDKYIAVRQAYIDSLCRRLAGDNIDTAAVLMQISDAYTGFNNDSALVYLDRGTRLRGAEALPFRWKRAAVLPLSGLFDEAVQTYNDIDTAAIRPADKADYLDAGRQMHSYIAAFFRTYPVIASRHDSLANDYQRRMLEILPHDSREYRFNCAEYKFLTGSPDASGILLEDVYEHEPEDSKYRARAAHHLSSIALAAGDEAAYSYYLASSALADALAATREVVSLQQLGANVYASGDISRAHIYLTAALENAVECGAPLRMIDTSRTLPIIERAHSDYLAANKRTVFLIMCVMAVLLIALVVIMLILRREMRKMRALEATLRAANTAKEVYISQFLQLCSIYMDKLNQFCKIATRKLAAGQADELYRMTKSGRFVEEQSREFYEVFDNAFLHIYPDFVERVNALLRPDAQIVLADGELLNTDLRILAFLRLGIEESARIAQILNYSLNTIYSYRNRLKARAVNRDTFDADIMAIDSTR